MNRWIQHSLLAALVLAVGGVGFWLGHDARSDSAATTEPAPPDGADAGAPVAAVQTLPLSTGTVAHVVNAYGTIQAAPGSSANVSVPFDAIVQRVLVTPGAKVTKETPVIEVGPTAETKLQFQQARDAVAAADRNVEDARMRLAEQLATNADVAAAEQAQQLAHTQLANLQQRGISEARVVAADTDGFASVINVQPGQVVTAGTSLVTIETERALEAIVGVEPADARTTNVGDSVMLRDIHDSPDAPATTGTVRLIGPQLNPQTQLRDVTIALPAESILLRSAFIAAQMETTPATGLVVPRSAVLPDDDDSVVFVVHDGKASRHVVTVTQKGAEQLIVSADDLRGDAIVIAGNAELEDGVAVRVEAPTTEATTGPATEAK